MQIIGQQAQVQHQFEHVFAREITALTGDNPAAATVTDVATNSNLNVRLEQNALRSSEQLSSGVDTNFQPSDLDTVKLTPEQSVKKSLLESLEQQKDNKALLETLKNLSELYGLTDKTASAENVKTSAISQTSLTLDFSVQALSAQLSNAANSDLDNDQRFSVVEYLYQNEQLDYQVQVSLTDDDNQTYQAELAVSFAREIEIVREQQVSLGELKDPLILNLSGNPQLLSGNNQNFDLDADGQQESIPQLNKGVYYLAFDHNQSGQIESGYELFGARTGDGFAELAELDDNQDGQIDRRDNAFEVLQLWNGKSDLSPLSSLGVQAISLNAQQTPFTFTDDVGNPRAQLQQTSFFVSEQNTLGAVHQVDYVV